MAKQAVFVDVLMSKFKEPRLWHKILRFLMQLSQILTLSRQYYTFTYSE